LLEANAARLRGYGSQAIVEAASPDGRIKEIGLKPVCVKEPDHPVPGQIYVEVNFRL
jgi:hypothetical protein